MASPGRCRAAGDQRRQPGRAASCAGLQGWGAVEAQAVAVLALAREERPGRQEKPQASACVCRARLSQGGDQTPARVK